MSLLLFLFPSLTLCDCEQDAQTVAPGRGGPTLTPQQAAEDFSLYRDFSSNTYTSCTVQQDVYRSYRGAFTSADTSQPPEGPCRLGPECKFTKVNSIQVSSCSELLDIRDSLVREGGYTALCRHGLTDWTMKPQEDFNCKPTGLCTATPENKLMQRQLSPGGLRRSKVVGQSLKEAGVVIDSLSSSPFERCKMSALQVGAAYGITDVQVERGPLSSSTDFRDYARAFAYTSLEGQGSADVKKIVAVRCRQWLQEDWASKTATGNRMAYAHSSTVGSCLNIPLDEGDCAWVKPVDSIYSNIQRAVQLSNHTFENVMDLDAKRVELLAVLSPEQMQKLGQCSLLRDDMRNQESFSNSDSTILVADSNKDLKISSQEFADYCSSRNCAETSEELWEIVVSLNARPYWKSKEEKTEFLVGEHVYFNGGWRELKFSEGGWMFPWHKTTLDTIRPTITEIKQILSPLDFLVENIAKIGLTEAALVANCTPKTKMKKCALTWLSYNPVPTSSSADPLTTRAAPVDGTQYPYMTSVDIQDTPNPLFTLARCLVDRGHVTKKKMTKMMGCHDK